jgi:hypothetical protein
MYIYLYVHVCMYVYMYITPTFQAMAMIPPQDMIINSVDSGGRQAGIFLLYFVLLLSFSCSVDCVVLCLYVFVSFFWPCGEKFLLHDSLFVSVFPFQTPMVILQKDTKRNLPSTS